MGRSGAVIETGASAACQGHFSQPVSSQQTPETKARTLLKVVWTLWKLGATARPHRRENFFLSRNWSPSHPRSKLCVLAGPEPSGPEPVLLQVLSIYRPRQCAHGSEKSPQLQHKGSRDARVWEVKTSCFSAVWTNHQQRRFKDQADTFFSSCSVGFKLKDFSRSCKVSKSTDCS